MSSIFLVPRKDGGLRLILNLKQLNSFVMTNHFKMEDQKVASRLFTRGCFMATVDLKNAYHLVPISVEHQKYLRFKFNGQLYQYVCLPFGLNAGPYIFTKLMKPVTGRLRANGFQSVVYLDNWMLFGDTVDSCNENISQTISLLKSLGFVVNREKSNLIPSQICQFLGILYDSRDFLLKLPVVKQSSISTNIRTLMRKKECSIEQFASILGQLVAACPAVNYGWAHTKN